MKSTKVLFVFAVAGLCAAALLTMPEAVTAGAKKGLSICAGVLIPSLFPFLALSGFLSSPAIAGMLGRAMRPVTRTLFGLPGECGIVILLSAVGGFPVGARMTAKLFAEGRIAQKEAHRLLSFCVNAGPAFLMTAVGAVMLGSRRAGFVLFAATTVSMLLLGMVQGILLPVPAEKRGPVRQKEAGDDSIAYAFTAAVGDAVPAMLSICAWMILFSCLVSVLGNLVQEEPLRRLVFLFAEVTLGAQAAAREGDVALIAGLVGFGGFCVHCQVLPFVQSTGMPYLRFLLFRCLSGVLSFGVAKILLAFFPCDIAKDVALRFSYQIFSVSVPATLALLFLCAVLICSLSAQTGGGDGLKPLKQKTRIG
ncbi:MAG: hypothetical protein LBS36_12575 [Oscillospiraceae bacterium]|nr:hypothetical protein [Oscillospiraceae bacterium]